MKFIKDTFIVKADKSERPAFTLSDGTKLYSAADVKTPDGQRTYIEPIVAPYMDAVQHGTIEELPMNIDAFDYNDKQIYFYDVELAKGDHICFHHYVTNIENCLTPDLPITERLYKCAYNDIYCVIRNGEIIPIEKYLFASYVLEPEENTFKMIGETKLILKTEREKIPFMARIEYASKYCREAGLNTGDLVFHKPGANYEMKVNDKDLLRMHLSWITAKLNEVNGMLEAVNDFVFISEHRTGVVNVHVADGTPGVPSDIKVVGYETTSGILIANEGLQIDFKSKKQIIKEKDFKTGTILSVGGKCSDRLKPGMNVMFPRGGGSFALKYNGLDYTVVEQRNIFFDVDKKVPLAVG